MDEWRAIQGPRWWKDIGYRLQDVLRQHRYDTNKRGSRRPDDPGWHSCTCGWEGYWSNFEPHVADHLRAEVVDECVCNIGAQECPVHPGRLLTQEQKIAVRKTWDARVPNHR